MAEGKLGLPIGRVRERPPVLSKQHCTETSLHCSVVLNGKKIGEFWGYDTKCIVGPRRRAVQQQQPSDLQVRKGREDLQDEVVCCALRRAGPARMHFRPKGLLER